MSLIFPASLKPSLVISGAIAVGLALTHLYCGYLRFVSTPRSRWLSAAGGVSVAYVFVHILPELSEHQKVLKNTLGLISYIEHHVYLIALVGLGMFYGLERIANESRESQLKSGKGDITTIEVFWLHISSFAIYNALIGYLLVHREEKSLANMLFFALAMALHFLVNDQGLREHHKHIYDRVGRWILAGTIILGWVIGAATEINQAALAVLFAFLAGSIILNVMKEELPEERESRFWAFAAGAVIYSVLLLSL